MKLRKNQMKLRRNFLGSSEILCDDLIVESKKS